MPRGPRRPLEAVRCFSSPQQPQSPIHLPGLPVPQDPKWFGHPHTTHWACVFFAFLTALDNNSLKSILGSSFAIRKQTESGSPWMSRKQPYSVPTALGFHIFSLLRNCPSCPSTPSGLLGAHTQPSAITPLPSLPHRLHYPILPHPCPLVVCAGTTSC